MILPSSYDSLIPEQQMHASVIILTKNAGEGFAKVLATVRAQETDWPFEIIVVDHNSSDGTVAFVKQYDDVKLIEIPQAEFGHGRTRNLAISEAKGEFCALLTQDALPASKSWLSEIVATVAQASDIAGAFGPHLAYPKHSSYLHRDLQIHFERFQKSPFVVSKDTDFDRYQKDPLWRQFLHFFSDNNSCLRRSAWEKIPYPDVDFAEDQVWAAKIIEAGWKKAYAPSAPVFHSHEFGVFDQLRRAYDESRSFRRSFGYRLGGNLRQTIRSGIGLSRTDWKWGRSRNLPLREILHRMVMDFALAAGHSLGTHDDRIPTRIQILLSRDKSLYQRDKRSSTCQGHQSASHSSGAATKLQDKFTRAAGSLDQCLPAVYGYLEPKTDNDKIKGAEPNRPPDLAHLCIHWVTPNFELVSGGMRNIFELIHYLENKGHKNRLYVFGETHYRDGEHARRTISERYRPFNAEVVLGIENMPYPDILISAGWQTAWPAYNYLSARKKFYLVQDYEPYFYPRGSDHILSEMPLRFDWYGISLGPWAEKIAAQFGMRSTPFDFASDHETFYPRDDVVRDDNTVVYYGRHVTPRRAYELGIAALYLVSKERPDTRIIIHGWEKGSGRVPFDHFDLGVIPDDERAQLYRQATVGMALSVTNPSMVPLEMMGCKLPVVELRGDNTLIFYGDEHDKVVTLSEPLPRAIADTIVDLLDNAEKRKARAEAGYAYTLSRTWHKAGDVVERTLIDELKRNLG